MFEAPNGFKDVLRTSNRRECQESRLVLLSAGIPLEMIHASGSWYLIVPENMADSAIAELEIYRAENPDSDRRRSIVREPIFGGSLAGIIIYSITLMLLSIASAQSWFDFDWHQNGRTDAALIRDWQWWRCLTALTLHADPGHLGGNLVFGSLFGMLVGRSLGIGIGWLAIISTGFLGNLVNAYVHDPSHTSIGASTAVFGMLGILAIRTLITSIREQGSRFKRWSPLIAALALLGYLGVEGPRTDIGAHVWGFAAGLAIGGLLHRVNGIRSRPWTQWLAGGAAILIILTAWIIAYRHTIMS